MKWGEFGSRLSTARAKAGISNQAELASLIGVRQQTVSRWEQGMSRPRVGQIPDLARALRCDIAELLLAAGYAPSSPPQATFDQPWPIDALSPTSFERFCTYFLESLFPDADVHRYGDQGHKQDGLDVEAIFGDGRLYTFQCKRHTSFGPAKVDAAVKAHTKEAARKVILLSSVASTQAREAVKRHRGWELWDREDISRRIRRDLPKAKQRIFVNVFFAGQHLALIGETEPSPWYTAEAFFAPSIQITRAFSHFWKLIGRDAELEELLLFVKESRGTIAMLIAGGGAGKSRLLKALADRLESERFERDIYFLSRDALTTKSLDELGLRPKLLICDDAHDRDDLGLLFDYVADPSKQARLIVSMRNYGRARVIRQARLLSMKETRVLSLPRLSLVDSEALARQALSRFGGSEELASRLAAHTRDCPLATVIGAEVLSTTKAFPPEFLLSEENFRGELLRRLITSIVEGVSSGLNANAVRVTLAAFSLLQPIRGEDQALTDALATLAGLTPAEIAHITRRLRDAGVLFQRGFSSRVAPDLLADFILEEECIGALGQSTGFSERVFDAVPAAYSEHILTNLGRLDWIKSNGNTRQSRLLDALWKRLDTSSEEASTYLRAAITVAFYQPQQALTFAARLIQQGTHIESASKIARNAAYNYDSLPTACELLWELGKRDSRPLGRNPSHPIRILAELASPEPHKPIAYIESVVDFALALIPQDESWGECYTPLDIVTDALATEGNTTSSTHREVRMNTFLVSGKNITSVRKKIVEACIELLFDSHTARGCRAAELLEATLRFPMGLFNVRATDSDRDQWAGEFCSTLKAIDDQLAERSIAPVVFNRLARAVSWHANYFEGATTILAKSVLARGKDDITSRAINLLIGGWGRVIGERDEEYSLARRNLMFDEHSTEFLREFPEPEALRSFLEGCLRTILDARCNPTNSAYGLFSHLIWISPTFAKAVVEDARINDASLTRQFAGTALAKLLCDEKSYAEGVVAGNLASSDAFGMEMVAAAYDRYRPSERYSEIDIQALKKIVTSDSKLIAGLGAQAIGLVASTDRQLALELIVMANLSLDSDVADSYLAWLCNPHGVAFEDVTVAHIKSILKSLVSLQRLENYWIQEFLQKVVRTQTQAAVDFFKSRVERVLASDNWHYQPIPYGPYKRANFEFMDSPDWPLLLVDLFEWARAHADDVRFRYQFSYLIEGLCAPFGADFFAFLEEFAESANPNDLVLVLTILRESSHSFVFEQEGFVIRFFRRAKSFGTEMLERAMTAFSASAIGGVRSGVPGKPFPRDLALRDAAEDVLSRLGRFEPAYQLYRVLLDDANAEIERQERLGQAMDEEDE